MQGRRAAQAPTVSGCHAATHAEESDIMPEQWIQSFIVIGLVWALTLAVAYLITRFTEGPRAALRRVLVVGPVFAAIAAILVLGILLLNGRTLGSGIWFWWIVLAPLILIEVGHTLSWPSRRRRAGEPLLVFARSRTHKIWVVLGGILAILGVAMTAGDLLGTPIVRDVLLGLLFLALGVELLCAGRIPVRATERGLLDFWRFVEWPSIASYRWRDGHDGVDSTLIMTLRNRRFFVNDIRPLLFRRVEWKVRMEQKEAVDSLVQGFVPAATAGPAPHLRS